MSKSNDQSNKGLKKETPRTLSHTSRKSAAHRNPNSPSKKYFYPKRYGKILGEISIDDIDFNANNVLQDRLDSTIWDKEGKLKSAVRASLLKAAKDFYQFLKIDAKIRDIILVGSMAHYSYNDSSDIDVHVVIDYNGIDEDEDFVAEYLYAKKSVWNSKYDIKIRGHEIELYAQNSEAKSHSNGEYSIAHNKWNIKPTKKKSKIDVEEVKKKVASFIGMIEKAESSDNYEIVGKLVDRISDRILSARAKGLESDEEELSAENLAFKYLRKKGYLDKLSDLKTQSFNSYISIDEKSKDKLNEAKDIEDDENWLTIKGDIDGLTDEKIEIIKDWICFVQDKLKLKEPLKVILLAEREEGMTTAAYSPYYNENYVVCGGRGFADILKSIAHELTHNRQRELGLFKVADKVQDYDSRPNSIESEANSMAGCLIKDYAKNYGGQKVYEL